MLDYVVFLSICFNSITQEYQSLVSSFFSVHLHRTVDSLVSIHHRLLPLLSNIVMSSPSNIELISASLVTM